MHVASSGDPTEPAEGPPTGPAAGPARRPRRWLHLLLGIAVGAVFLVIALWKADMAELRRALLSVDLRYFPVILGTLAAYFWFKAVRWSVLLGPLRAERPLRARDVFPGMMVGFMFNNLLPAHLGEFVRMYVIGRQFALSKTAVLSTIVLERMLDFLGVLAFLAMSLQFLPASEDLQSIRTAGYVIAAGCAVVFAVFLAFVWRTGSALRLAETASRIVRLPARARERIVGMLSLGIHGMASLRSPRAVAGLLFLTLFHWSFNGLGLYLSVISFPGHTEVPVVAGFFLLAVTALGVTVPSAPGYVGTFQICFAFSLGAFGVGREQAIAASVYWMFFSYVPITLAGYWCLQRLGLGFRAVSREAELDRELVEPK